MTSERRAKLEAIHKRESLKGMLVHKFKLKYGDHTEGLISSEINKFMKNDRLTEENLKRLDEKICAAAAKKGRAGDALSEHRSMRSKSSRGSRRSIASK